MKYMIQLIKQYWYYEDGVLESMSENEIRDIYERLIDWLN